MGQLIADMLTLARIARAELTLEPVNVTRIARSICEDLAGSDPARRVDVTIAGDLTAAGDSRLLTVVLSNLLGNAWKFTSKCPEPRISLTRCASETDDVFLVADNGAGFEMKYVEKLFRPFQRLHADAEFMGSGVGLATVQRIIARHGGKVWAEATVGKGARVFFSVPRRSLSGKASA
jgi:light-regulated signal transduction histidine kinase (bacteriophytochrome)